MSLQTRNLPITLVPLSQIHRPIQPELDQQKIESMVQTMSGRPTASSTCSLQQAIDSNGQLPAVDVLKVKEPSGEYYFAFGGCHRLQAYDKLKPKSGDADVMVRCKVLNVTRKQIKMYVGNSIDTMFQQVDRNPQLARAASSDSTLV
ncbi:hypothetical protein TBLA_0A00770 [Henningerozyma blattae CBS 6284]|uniref:Sulfiredoxin n=1 Tax=Henningerozyma blattae (strain ATCC 34711 / CBS 6284 / DSM 70876 / NBRC 10599 / NRRL Y-10934 / UCD 77-7) TaxID=1071380 RepID=I2GUS6_HENB6|nr:hypothetical protein TBLA_0A00770 [Tetrapisispora blattae CBS 6284]CCH57878.1 hypothetical protein TBLA_0A00770 [Tetrapisispora blattae CBS 6284]